MKNEMQCLRDVLRTADYEQFQRTVAQEMVRELRKKQRAKLQRRFLALAACVPLAMMVWLVGQKAVAPNEGGNILTVVRSEGLPEETIVRTRGGVEIIRTQGGIETVEESSQSVTLLSDAEVLELLRGQAVVIVRGITGAKLIIPENR